MKAKKVVKTKESWRKFDESRHILAQQKRDEKMVHWEHLKDNWLKNKLDKKNE